MLLPSMTISFIRGPPVCPNVSMEEYTTFWGDYNVFHTSLFTNAFRCAILCLSNPAGGPEPPRTNGGKRYGSRLCLQRRAKRLESNFLFPRFKLGNKKNCIKGSTKYRYDRIKHLE